jgi:outer membrane lipoprotein-sorting protein
MFSFCTAFSQNNTSAENILDKSSAKIKSAKGINVSFSLTQKDKQNQVVSNSKGIMKMKGDKYYINQDGSEIYCNGLQIWNFDGQDEVTVAKVYKDDNEFSPPQILTGFNKKDFNIKLVSSAGNNYQVLLTPLDKRQNFKEITLYINKSTSLISKASVVSKMNDTIEINFNSISLNASFDDSQFVFDAKKHPGIDIINN